MLQEFRNYKSREFSNQYELILQEFRNYNLIEFRNQDELRLQELRNYKRIQKPGWVNITRIKKFQFKKNQKRRYLR